MRTMDLILNVTITIKINIHYAAFLFFSIFFDVVGWRGDCLYMMFCCPYEDVKGGVREDVGGKGKVRNSGCLGANRRFGVNFS